MSHDNELLVALTDLMEAAVLLLAGCERHEGRHPEEDDVCTHESGDERRLKKASDAARAVIAKTIGDAK